MTIVLDSADERAAAIAATQMSEDLFDILVCPVDKSDLRLEHASLVCLSCGRAFPVTDGIPNMLVDDHTAE